MEPQLTLTLTVILSLVALAASVLSPILTALITNHHQRKMHEINFFETHRAETIERYIQAAGAVIRSGTQSTFTEYGACLGEIYFYVPQDLWWHLDQISHFLNEPNYKSAADHFTELCKKLANDPPRRNK